MREILFRGKEKLTGVWRYGSLLKYPNAATIKQIYGDRVFHTATYEIIPETVGQFTGLTDKNGTKIFEGDIVKGKSEYFGNGSLNQKAVVLYDRGQFLLSFGETLEECKQLNDFEVVGVWSGDVEVIGNVHDNPELLKE